VVAPAQSRLQPPKQIARSDPEVRDQEPKRVASVNRSCDGIMLPRTELAADPSGTPLIRSRHAQARDRAIQSGGQAFSASGTSPVLQKRKYRCSIFHGTGLRYMRFRQQSAGICNSPGIIPPTLPLRRQYATLLASCKMASPDAIIG
jgi:hypothetical protein